MAFRIRPLLSSSKHLNHATDLRLGGAKSSLASASGCLSRTANCSYSGDQSEEVRHVARGLYMTQSEPARVLERAGVGSLRAVEVIGS